MAKAKKISKQEELKRLRERFRYYEDGTPDIFQYGEFRKGVTNSEIDDYLKVRANKLNIKAVRAKFDKVAGCNTCPVAQFDGQNLGLMYRHDVERFANQMFDGTPNYWD